MKARKSLKHEGTKTHKACEHVKHVEYEGTGGT